MKPKNKRLREVQFFGLTIVAGVAFALLSFLGSYGATFLWAWGQTDPKSIAWNYISGAIALIAFIILSAWIARTAYKIFNLEALSRKK